jgi:hypothetical protein
MRSKLTATPLEPAPAPAPVRPERQQIFTLEQLQEMCEKKKAVDFEFDGVPVRVEVRRLRGDEDAQIEQILAAVMPPMKPGAKGGEMIPAIDDPAYQKKKIDAEVHARSVAIYWCVPIFAAAKPGLTNASEIINFVNSKFNPEILGMLFQAVRNGGVSLATLVNFT